jgi:ATP-dependent Clp protease ATP-binding subunit ClpC
MGRRNKHKRYPISEEHIAEVISMMTGIPVKRMVEAETEPSCVK